MQEQEKRSLGLELIEIGQDCVMIFIPFQDEEQLSEMMDKLDLGKEYGFKTAGVIRYHAIAAIFATNDPELSQLYRKIITTMDPISSKNSLVEVVKVGVTAYQTLGHLPQTQFSWKLGEGTSIVCLEPTCRFHNKGSCSHTLAMQFDDNPQEQWCMAYEGKV